MTRTIPVALFALACLTVGCGGEKAPGDDSPSSKPSSSAADLQPEKLRPLFLGTWDYEMRYPSGDEIATVRLINDDGTGAQWNKETGEASKQDFRWEITADGKTLKLKFGEVMVSEYGIVSATAAQHVLKNAHGLDETCIKR